MKINYRIILFISLTVILLILALIHTSQCNTYTNIIEKYANNDSRNIYTRQLQYNNIKPQENQIYNTDVLNSDLPVIYDVRPQNVNLCYGDGNTSIFTFPYIVLLLRASYLYNNNNAKSQEFIDIMSVLSASPIYVKDYANKNNNIQEYILKESRFIYDNSQNKAQIMTRTGPNLVKACSRLYPNWLMNPTSPSQTQLNQPQDIFINKNNTSDTNNNPSTFAAFYTNKKPSRTQLDVRSAKNILQETTVSTSDPPTLNTTNLNILPSGAESFMYIMDINNYQNNNSEYCSLEWTSELALANNIGNSINDKDICLKILLNPITGDILQSTFVQFNSSSLSFSTNDIPDYVFHNMVTLIQTNTDNNMPTYGIQPTQFNTTPNTTNNAKYSVKIDKYIFDNCGRLYGVPTNNPKSGDTRTYTFNGKNFDLTQIYANNTNAGDLSLVIKSISALLTGSPLPAYNVISSAEVGAIATGLIDNIYNLTELYKATIYSQFNAKYFDPNTINTNTKPNMFATYFMDPNNANNDPYYNIINYTSSDGYIYINLGQIHDSISLAITKYITGGMTQTILTGFRTILLKQINTNYGIISKYTTQLQSLQTQLYGIINTITAVIPAIFNIFNGTGGNKFSFKLPFLNGSQIKSLSTIANLNGYGNQQDYDNVQSLLYETTQNIASVQYVNIDPNNYLPYIQNTFNTMLDTTKNNGQVTSLFTQQNIIKLITCDNLFYTVCYGNVISNPPFFKYGNNLLTANYILMLFVNSFVSLLYYKINKARDTLNKIIWTDLPDVSLKWYYLMNSLNKFWRDFWNYLATGFWANINWNRGGGGSSISQTIIPNVASVINNKGNATALNVAGVNNTVSQGGTTNQIVQNIYSTLNTITNTNNATIPGENVNLGNIMQNGNKLITQIYFTNT